MSQGVTIALAGLGVLSAYQLDQAARVILVEAGPGLADGGVTLDEEAAGIARVLRNRCIARGRLPSQVIRTRPGQGVAVWTMRLPEYLDQMARRGPGTKGYTWALARAAGGLAGTEGTAVGRRKTFLHLSNAWFKDHPVPEWASENPITIGRTTFAGTP